MDPLHYGYGYDPPPDWRVGWERDMPMLAGRFVLTLPARISPRKGQDDFLALIAALRERGIPAHGLRGHGSARATLGARGLDRTIALYESFHQSRER